MPRSPVSRLQLPVSPAWIPAHIALRRAGRDAHSGRAYGVSKPAAVPVGVPAYSSLTTLTYDGRSGLVRTELPVRELAPADALSEVAMVLEPSADLFVVVEPDMSRAAWAFAKGRLAKAAYPMALSAMLLALAGAEAVAEPTARPGAFFAATSLRVMPLYPAALAAAAGAARAAGIGGEGTYSWAAPAMVALLYVVSLPLAQATALATAMLVRCLSHVSRVGGALSATGGMGGVVAMLSERGRRVLDVASACALVLSPSAAAVLGVARTLGAAAAARRACAMETRPRYKSREGAEIAVTNLLAHAERLELWAAVSAFACVPHVASLAATCLARGAWIVSAQGFVAAVVGGGSVTAHASLPEALLAAPLALLPLCLPAAGDGLDAMPALAGFHYAAAGSLAWCAFHTRAYGVPECSAAALGALCVSALAARRVGAREGDVRTPAAGEDTTHDRKKTE